MTEIDRDSEHESAMPTEQEWRTFERQVAALLETLDSRAEVEHDVDVLGKLSGTNRQVDVLVKGLVAGQQIVIAVECKRYKQPLGIGAVDEFAGKLADLGADRGVLFALNGLTGPARERAQGSVGPRIAVGDLSVASGDIGMDFQKLISPGGFGDCPNESCMLGDVRWRYWTTPNLDRLRSGQCTSCGTWAAECPECAEVVDFFMNSVDCHSCGSSICLVTDRKASDIVAITVETSGRERRYEPADI